MSSDAFTEEMKRAFLAAYIGEWDDPSDSNAAEIAGFDAAKDLGYSGGTNPVLRELVRTGLLHGGETDTGPATIGPTDAGRRLAQGPKS